MSRIGSVQTHDIPTYAVAGLDADRRGAFLVKVYGHLFGAILLFVALEVAAFQSGLVDLIVPKLMGVSWLVVLGGFMVVGWLASRFANSSASKPVQYAALIGFVAAQALIFSPMLWYANKFAGGSVIGSAALITLLGFTGLTGYVIASRKNFNFMGGILRLVGIGALLAIVGSVVFGFSLGMLFSVGMVVFACAAILYDTSRVLHTYPEDRYVGAALSLFASVALLFWYVLQIFISQRD